MTNIINSMPTKASTSNVSVVVRDRSTVEAHLGLAFNTVTTTAINADFAADFIPGTHAWSPPRC